MNEGEEPRAAFRVKSAELALAGFFLLLGALVIYDSVRLGIGWRDVEGPQPGYFPFYVGAIIVVASLVNVVRALLVPQDRNATFVQRGQLKLVLTVLVPTAMYAALVGWIGIYVSSILFISFFMRWLGRYSWWKVVAVSVGAAVLFYLIFEIWFKVPLPKGPVESFLHLD
jgi:hypothetical protein